MAELIDSSVDSQVIGSSYSLWKYILIGVFLGLLHHGVFILLGNYIKTDSVTDAISTIIVGTIGTVVMARFYIPQALLINIAAGASIWGLSGWVTGLMWYEIVGFSMLLYGLSYVLFSWVARFTKFMPVIISMLVIVVAARIASAL